MLLTIGYDLNVFIQQPSRRFLFSFKDKTLYPNFACVDVVYLNVCTRRLHREVNITDNIKYVLRWYCFFLKTLFPRYSSSILFHTIFAPIGNVNSNKRNLILNKLIDMMAIASISWNMMNMMEIFQYTYVQALCVTFDERGWTNFVSYNLSHIWKQYVEKLYIVNHWITVVVLINLLTISCWFVLSILL